MSIISPLMYRVHAVPAQATAEIVAAYKASGACAVDTAKALGISEQSFWRYVGVLGIKPRLAEMSEEAKRMGWHHGRVGGRPRKKQPRGGPRRARGSS